MNYVTLTQQDNNLIVFLSSGAKGLEACSLRTPGAKSNWVDKSGGLPAYICNIAKEIKKTGKSESEAIAIAVSRAKVWAAGGAKVTGATKAKAAAAVAQWEALKAKADSKSLVKASRQDGSTYLMELANGIQSFNVDNVRTAFNAKQQAASQAKRAQAAAARISGVPFDPDNDGDDDSAEYAPLFAGDYAYIREMWTDHVIVETNTTEGQELYSVPYSVADDDEVSFGSPQEVKVQYVAVQESDDELDADDLELLNDILKMSASQLAYQRIVGLSHSLKGVAMAQFKASAALAAEEDLPPGLLTLSELFEEEPVSLDVFIHDRKFLGSDWSLSPIQERAVRLAERVYLPEMYPLMSEEWGGYWEEILPMKNLLTFQWGKGSGKDHVCRIISLRVAYNLLCLKSPQLYFGMPESDSIHMLNIAANSGQANRAFFKPLTQSVKRGWFRDKAEPKRDSIQYVKNLEAVSGHSDAEGQEGLNLILGVADEIDAFKAKDEMVGQGKKAREASTSAETILKMLKGSASTRFPYSYKRVAISYPRYKGSTIQKLTTEAEEDIKAVGPTSIYFASGPYATWEVNPLRKGKEEFASDYRTNPEEAAAMYECKPTRATNPYFRNNQIFKQAVDRDVQPVVVDYVKTLTTTELTGASVEGWNPVFTFASDFLPMAGARYALHGDLAIVGDRAGIAMSHVEKFDERVTTQETEDGRLVETTEIVPIVRNDFVFGFEADIAATPSREIQIHWVRMLVLELIKRGFYVASFTFDGFQSTDVIQTLNRWGIPSEKLSADRTDDVWKTLKSVAGESRLHMPFEQLLLNELEGLSRINGKVDHPANGSKDLADAFACSIVGAINAGGEEDPNGETIEVGVSYFEMGEPISELIGVDDMFDEMGSLAMPIGMGV